MFPLTLLLATLAPLPGGTVRVVDPALGPYFNVQSAVDAATDGDTVLVRAGVYPPFTVVNKELAVVGDVMANVQFTGGIHLRDLAAEKTLVLQNVRAQGASVLAHGLLLGQNAGSVRVESCTFEGRSLAPCAFSNLPGDGVRILQCADVALIRCAGVGGAGASEGYVPPPSGTGGFGFFANASVVALFSGTAIGGGATVCCDGNHGGSGGRGTGASRLFVAGTACVGANGGVANCSCALGGDGGSGLLVHDVSELWMFRPTFQAGNQGSGMGGFGCPSIGGSPGVALFVADTAQATDVAFGGLRTLVVTPSPARAGTSVTVTVHGTPGESVSLLIGDDAMEELRPEAHGVLLVESAGPPRRVHLGTIPASGMLVRQLPIASLPAGQESRVFHLQSWHGGIPPERVLGAPACLVVLDPAF